MAKRPSYGGGGGMASGMGSMLAKAQKMQADMAAAQAEAESSEVEATAGGGVVTVRATGGEEDTEREDIARRSGPGRRRDARRPRHGGGQRGALTRPTS